MPDQQQRGLPKWLISVPLLFIALVLLLISLPLTVPVALLVSLHPAFRGAARALAFLLCYVLCETAGVVVSIYLWFRYPLDSERSMAAHFRLQSNWAAALMAAARRIFGLTFHVHNSEALSGPGVILMPRHASIADTILPMTYYAIPQNRRLRYVLKKELQWDPCLELVGNRLPNYFIDRASESPEEEIVRLAQLLKDTPAEEGILIYPEGTRYSETKHSDLLKKAPPGSELAEQLQRWPKLLPPRLGGCLGLLSANTRHDLLFFAHSGFEGSASFAELANGSWTNSHVHLEFWRVPFAEIPVVAEAQKAFILAQWDQMHRTVERLDALRTRP